MMELACRWNERYDKCMRNFYGEINLKTAENEMEELL